MQKLFTVAIFLNILFLAQTANAQETNKINSMFFNYEIKYDQVSRDYGIYSDGDHKGYYVKKLFFLNEKPVLEVREDDRGTLEKIWLPTGRISSNGEYFTYLDYTHYSKDILAREHLSIFEKKYKLILKRKQSADLGRCVYEMRL